MASLIAHYGSEPDRWTPGWTAPATRANPAHARGFHEL